MAAVKLSELRTRVRELADLETGAQASAFNDDAEVNRALNRALRQLYNHLILHRGADFYVEESSFSTSNGVTKYALPADFFQLLEVIADDGNAHFSVPKWGMKDLAEFKTYEQSTAGSIYNLNYRVRAKNIELRPKPGTTSLTITLHYIPTLAELSNDNDTYEGFNGFEDWACYNAAIDLLNKEESSRQAQALAGPLARLDAQIKSLAGTRDASRAEKVQDVRKTSWQHRRARRRYGVGWDG